MIKNKYWIWIAVAIGVVVGILLLGGEIRIEIPDVVLTAIVVAGGAILTTVMNGRQIRRGKEQDFARQDVLAEQAAHIVRSAAEQTKLNFEITDGKIEQVHQLSNSNLDAERERTLRSKKQQLVLMREIVALHQSAGRKPSPEALEAIEDIGTEIRELSEQIEGRKKATAVADAKLTQGEDP